MIIIDQVVETKLTEALEKLKDESQNARAIYVDLKGLPISSSVKEKVVASAQNQLGSVSPQLYLSEDGDIFILAPIIPSKEAKAFLLDVGSAIGKAVSDEWAQLMELPLHSHMLLSKLDAKIEKRRKQEEEKRKLLEKQQAERKRQAILNAGVETKSDDIKNRRASRHEAQLMIIEDDAFSRRLVEKVLQKQYALSGLGEATHALETYARIAPDLLFLDIDLPDVTGHELLEKILKLDPDAYVIMLSGNADKDNITQAMKLGAKGFIAKPFTKEKLFQYIERCPTIHHERI